MKAEAQRIAIAEACGAPKGGWWCFLCERWIDPEHVTFHETHDQRCGGCGNPVEASPDYLTDLNAMQSAEKTLNAIQWLKYWQTLCRVVWGSPITMESNTRLIWECTAAQRAEAFLRTIGKWKD